MSRRRDDEREANDTRVTVWYDGGCPLCVRERLYRVFLVFRPAFQWVTAVLLGKRDPAVPTAK